MFCRAASWVWMIFMMDYVIAFGAEMAIMAMVRRRGFSFDFDTDERTSVAASDAEARASPGPDGAAFGS